MQAYDTSELADPAAEVLIRLQPSFVALADVPVAEEPPADDDD